MRAIFTTLLLVLYHGAYGAEAEDVFDQLQARWYVTEVVIFERTAASAMTDGEVLARHEPRSFPHPIITLRDDSAHPVPLEEATWEEARNFRMGRGRGMPHVRPRPPTQRTTRRDTSAAVSETTETVDEPAPPSALELFKEATQEFEASLARQALVPNDSYALTPQVEKLQRGDRHRILWHGRWMQPVPPRGQGTPVLIQTQPDDHGFRLQGSLGVTVGRYLHLDARLWLNAEYEVEAQPDEPSSPIPVESLTDQDHSSAGRSDVDQQSLAQPTEVTPGYFVLDERRRLRSDELHYLDHPKFGVLAIIQPVAIPEELVDALTAIEESDD